MQEYLKDIRIVQCSVLDYVGDERIIDKNLDNIKKLLNDMQISYNKEKFKSFLYLLIKIFQNHYRNSTFISKIEKIILILKDQIIQKFSKSEIFDIFGTNKRLLLFIFKENMINLDEKIIHTFENSFSNIFGYYMEYFSPEIKTFIETTGFKNKNNFSEKIITIISNELPENFYEKRLEGENDNYICTLIRNDSIIEFVKYVNQTNLSVDAKIQHSIYETNEYLITEQPSLIEYAAFYGSIQIYQYLRLNGSKLDPTLWFYSIHGKNAEIIHLLENDKIEPYCSKYQTIYKESVKCFHNDIANYIKNTYLINENEDDEKEKINENIPKMLNENKFSLIGLYYNNYSFFPDDLNSIEYIFFYLCKFNLFYLACLYLKSKNINESFLFNIDEFEIIDKLGDGILGESFIVKSKSTNKKYVVKSSKFVFNECQPEEYVNSFHIKYKTLLNIKGFCPFNFKHEPNPSILIDYFENGSLSKYLKNNKQNDENSSTRNYIILLGIAIGLKYLHSHNIVYQSFHPSNILLDENFYPIMSDFGASFFSLYSLLITNNIENIERMCYLSPGIAFDEQTTKADNIYSYAFMIYHVLTGKLQFKTKNEREQFIYNRKYDLDNYDSFIDFSMIKNEEIIDFIRKCYDKESSKEIKIDEIIDFITNKSFYSYFKSIDFDIVNKYLDIFDDDFKYLKEKFIISH